VTGHPTSTLPDAGPTTSSCTGKYSPAGYSLILTLPTDQGVFQLFVSVSAYHGPGTYTNGAGQQIRGGIINPERTSSWTSVPGDAATLTVGRVPGRRHHRCNLQRSQSPNGQSKRDCPGQMDLPLEQVNLKPTWPETSAPKHSPQLGLPRRYLRSSQPRPTTFHRS